MVDFNKFASKTAPKVEEKKISLSPKPLSFSNVQNEIAEVKKNEKSKISSAPSALFKNQNSINAEDVTASDMAKYPEFKPIEIARLKQTVNEINILEYSYALNFGTSVAEKANKKVNEALQIINQQSQKMLEIKSITDSLKQNLLNFATSQSTENSTEQKSLKTFIKNVFQKPNESRTLEDRVQDIIQITEKFELILKDKISLFEKTLEAISGLIEESKRNFIEVNILFLAGQEKLVYFEKHEKFRIEEKLESKNISVYQNARDSMDAYNFFKNKLDSFKQMIVSGQMTVEQMRLVRNNQVTNISTFQNIFMNLLPSWKQILLTSMTTGNFEKFNESNGLLLTALDDIITK